MKRVIVKDWDLSKKQEASGSLNNLGLKTPASKIPILGDICFMGINILI